MRTRLGMAAVILASVIGISSAFAEGKQVRVVHPPVGDMWPYFIAKKEGLFAKHGLDVQLNVLGVSSNVPAALASGSAELGVLTFSTLLPAIENGIDLVTVAGGTITDENLISAFVIKPDSDIKTAKDIEGKKVGVPGIGAFLQVLFSEWMTLKGGDYKKVTFVEVPFPQMYDVLRAGTVDGIIVVEPFFSRIIGAKAGVMKADVAKEQPQKYRVLAVAASREYATKNPDTIKALRAALNEAVEMHAKDPEKTRAIIGEFIKLPPQALAAIKMSGTIVKLEDKEIDAWTDLMIKQGSMTKKIQASKINIK